MSHDSACEPSRRVTWAERPHVAALAGLLCLALVALGGCGSASMKQASTQSTAPTPFAYPTAAPTPTLGPAHPLRWVSQTLPFTPSYAALAISGADGHTAYLCHIATDHPSAVEIWVTHDRAAHWQHAADVPTTFKVVSCTIVADDVNTNIAAITVCPPPPPYHSGVWCGVPLSFATLDGGVTWHSVSGTLPIFGQIATIGGTAFAVTHSVPHSVCFDCTSTLSVSRDGMRTWHDIGGGFGTIQQFWVNPSSGLLLARAQVDHYEQYNLATSADGGEHWSVVSNVPFMDILLAQAPDGAGWRGCGGFYSEASNRPGPTSMLTCTADGGKSWEPMGGPFAGIGPQAPYAFAIAADGAILGRWYASSGQAEIRRVIPGQNHWESLGTVPLSGFAVSGMYTGAFTYAGGVIWLAPTNANDMLAGPVVLTATYP